MNSPAVSILLPVRNETRFLPAALSSLLRQSLNDWELVAIDDGTTDRTGRLLDEPAARDRRVRVWHRSRGCQVNALNFGLRQWRGDYAARMETTSAIPNVDSGKKPRSTSCRCRHRQLVERADYLCVT